MPPPGKSSGWRSAQPWSELIFGAYVSPLPRGTLTMSRGIETIVTVFPTGSSETTMIVSVSTAVRPGAASRPTRRTFSRSVVPGPGAKVSPATCPGSKTRSKVDIAAVPTRFPIPCGMATKAITRASPSQPRPVGLVAKRRSRKACPTEASRHSRKTPLRISRIVRNGGAMSVAASCAGELSWRSSQTEASAISAGAMKIRASRKSRLAACPRPGRTADRPAATSRPRSLGAGASGSRSGRVGGVSRRACAAGTAERRGAAARVGRAWDRGSVLRWVG
jgi:hypothetical protein